MHELDTEKHNLETVQLCMEKLVLYAKRVRLSMVSGDPLDSMRTVRAAHQVPHSDANVITLHML